VESVTPFVIRSHRASSAALLFAPEGRSSIARGGGFAEPLVSDATHTRKPQRGDRHGRPFQGLKKWGQCFQGFREARHPWLLTAAPLGLRMKRNPLGCRRNARPEICVESHFLLLVNVRSRNFFFRIFLPTEFAFHHRVSDDRFGCDAMSRLGRVRGKLACSLSRTWIARMLWPMRRAMNLTSAHV
jgi:hypothetical protein